jgi:hypothetical protein
MPKFKISRFIQQQESCEINGHYTVSNKELPKSGSMKVRIQMQKRTSINGSLP